MDPFDAAFSFMGDFGADAFASNYDVLASAAGQAVGDSLSFGDQAFGLFNQLGNIDWGNVGSTLLGAGTKSLGSMLAGSGASGGAKMSAMPTPKAVNLPGGDIPTGYKGIPDAGKNKAVQSENPRGMYAQWQSFMKQFAYEGK
jgi:hypothetical protein